MKSSCTRFLLAALICTLLRQFPSIAQSSAKIDHAKLSEVLPPSPNAAELGKFGGVNVGMSSGMANLQVPVWTVSSRKLKLPVYLSYSAGGIKTDQIASRAGMGWVLEAGGVITRTVNGLADERVTMVTPPLSQNYTQEYLDFLQMITNTNVYDTQQDMFSFNFGGYSGRFVMDSSRNIHFLTKSNFKIEKDFSETAPWTFKITDGKGIQYYFGGIGATERSRKNQSGCGRLYNSFLPTAWYVKQIIQPGVDTISFVYVPCNISYVSGLSQSILKPPLGPLPTCGSDAPCPNATEISNCLQGLETEAVILQEIRTSAYTSLTFRHEVRSDLTGDSLIKKIRVYDHATGIPVQAREFTFNYQTAGTDPAFQNEYNMFNGSMLYRPFLVSMVADAGPQYSPQEYRFSYDRPDSLPPRLTFAQDHFGFFNGINNSTLVAYTDDQSVNEYFQQHMLADRAINPDKSIMGMLTRITYPTGGYDSLVYESNDYWGETYGAIPTSTEITSAASYVFHQEVYKWDTITVPAVQSLSMLYGRFTISTNVGDPSSSDPHDVTTVRLTDLTASEVIYEETYRVSAEQSHQLALAPLHRYKIEVTAEAGMFESSISAALTYQNAPQPVTYSNKPSAGVRIAKVLTYNENTNSFNVKKYSYRYLNKPDSSTGRFTGEYLQYVRFNNRVVSCPSAGHLVTDCGVYISIVSTTLNNLYKFPAGMISYPVVVESWGENYENGGIEYEFNVSSDAQAGVFLNDGVFGAPLTNRSWRNGLEKYKRTFKRLIDNSKKTIQEIYSYYTDDPRGSFTFDNYIFEKNYDLPSGSTADYLKPFNGGIFKVNGNWTYKDSMRTVTCDDNGQSSVVTEKYLYDNANHLQITRQRSFSSKQEELLTINRYPQDKAAMTGLTTQAEQALDRLIVDNQVEQIVETEEFNNGMLKLGSRNNYKIWAVNGRSFAAPENNELKYANNPRETRMVFSDYNQWESLLTQSKAQDVSHTYFWDYKSVYPVAHIQNGVAANTAYTSFEAESKGGWSYAGSGQVVANAPTGRNAFNLSAGTIVSQVLPAGIYHVTYWSNNGSMLVNGVGGTAMKTGDGWTLYEHKLTNVNQVTLSGNGWIDELRLLPQGAIMQTYTYDPLYGMSSQCDATNEITYYEYDAFGRLKRVRDGRRNIVKELDYQYLVSAQ